MGKLEMEVTSAAVAVVIEPTRHGVRIVDDRGSESGQGYLGRTAGERNMRMAEDVLDGLVRPLKELPSKYLYDAHGAALYERICELPEYYPARSARFTRQRVVAELSAAGLSLTEWVTDRDRLVALSLAHRPQAPVLGVGEARR
jgi:hypothetical protein